MTEHIKYRFAKNAAEELIDVMYLTDHDRQDYVCLSCGTILRPVLPKVRRKHFRHMTSVDCSVETYLHRAAKILVQNTYQDCLENTKPFYVAYYRPKQCTYCNNYGPCNVGEDITAYDLTKSFKSIMMETRDDGFIPDILLNNQNGEKIFIEIDVTHPCSDEKIMSGVRIIELSIDSESDLELIESKIFSVKDSRIRLINFNPKPIKGDFHGLCNERIPVFILTSSGKSVLKRLRVFEFEELCNRSDLFVEKAKTAHPTRFFKHLEAAYLDGRKVTNCFLCRYHATVKPRQKQKPEHSVYCKYSRKSCQSNYAADCSAYRPDVEVFRYSKAYNQIQQNDD